MRFKSCLTGTIVAFSLCTLSGAASAQTPLQPGEFAEFDAGAKSPRPWTPSIIIKTPALRSEVAGDFKVEFAAPGMTKAAALCWRQPTPDAPDPGGHDTRVGDVIELGADGNGAFLFKTGLYPNGPITLRLVAWNETQREVRELQLFNKGGVVWKQGIPQQAPPAAEGLKLVFSDDFDGPLSISKDGQGARYTSHKPGGGDFSGWPFSDFEGDRNPFSQVGTFLKIHASKIGAGPGSTGLLAPVKPDGTVFTAKAPAYFECRFTAQSAPGTWPAFWLLTKNKGLGGDEAGTDELDVIEAYGGVGQGNPNYSGYAMTSHFWGRIGADGKQLPDFSKSLEMTKLSPGASWSTTFHTYGVKVTESDTIYYLDDAEVFRHPSGRLTRTQPFFFLINYAIGGISGWKIDLNREGNASDMYVDYVRVYEGQK